MADERVDVMAVGAHPDDIEIQCGGTLATLVKQGYRVAIVDLTSGEPTPRGTLETRQAEAQAARAILGVQVRVNLDLPNRILMDGPEARYALATQFRRYRPKIVIGPHGRTVAASPDHFQAQLIVEAARFHSQLTKWNERYDNTEPYSVPNLVYAPIGDPPEVLGLRSTFVIDISDVMPQKLAAIQAYQSQFDGMRFEMVKHFISGRDAHFGASVGVRFAELFGLPRPLPIRDMVAGLEPVHPKDLPPGPG